MFKKPKILEDSIQVINNSRRNNINAPMKMIRRNNLSDISCTQGYKNFELIEVRKLY